MSEIQEIIETQVWEPDEDRPGYLKLIRSKTVGEVFAEITATLDRDEWGYVTTPGWDEYFNISGDADRPFPQGRLVVFPVTGGSEGHYIHVEVLDTIDEKGWVPERNHELVYLGKTFQGWDAAWTAAKDLAARLGV